MENLGLFRETKEISLEVLFLCCFQNMCFNFKCKDSNSTYFSAKLCLYYTRVHLTWLAHFCLLTHVSFLCVENIKKILLAFWSFQLIEGVFFLATLSTQLCYWTLRITLRGSYVGICLYLSTWGDGNRKMGSLRSSSGIWRVRDQPPCHVCGLKCE